MSLFDKFRREPTIRVHMLVSVDEFPAGENFDLPVDVADRFIIRHYATGDLSREYTAEEKNAMHANSQVVGV